jgi:inorganic pyrophosphatase
LVLKDVDQMFLKITDNFFKHYKDLEEQKKVTVRGWVDKKQALKIVDDCCERFRPLESLNEFVGEF